MSILDLLEDEEESGEVNELLNWWNRYLLHQSHLMPSLNLLLSQIFPTYGHAQRSISKTSPLARIKERRALLKGTATASMASNR